MLPSNKPVHEGLGAAVVSESQVHAMERLIPVKMFAHHGPSSYELRQIFFWMPRLLDVSAHRDPARLNACFENDHRWREVVSVG